MKEHFAGIARNMKKLALAIFLLSFVLHGMVSFAKDNIHDSSDKILNEKDYFPENITVEDGYYSVVNTSKFKIENGDMVFINKETNIQKTRSLPTNKNEN